MESVLKIENLKYKDILNDITFSLKEKTFNILVGSNGSGKTTLVNCIRGLLEYSGEIYVCNQSIKNNLNKIGFFINNNFLLEKNIFEELLNLLVNLDYKEEKAKQKIYSIAKKLDITNLLFKEQKDLLYYENTLVSFLFSVIHEPSILIIDNELENLHDYYKNKIIKYIKSQKKITVLFITTNSNYFYLTDNLIFLKDGKITVFESLNEAIKNEKNFLRTNSSLPFSIDLSNKLISYELLDNTFWDIEEMVNEIWK